jgi:hypothetical protein
MKKSLYLVAIAIGFGISCALWSNGFIFHPVYAPPPIVLESVQVIKNLNLLAGQKNSIKVMCPQGMILTGGGYTMGGYYDVAVTIATPSGPVNGPATGYLFGAHNKMTNSNINILVVAVCLKTNYP